MPRIELMPPLLANQIAAGEVVERPASVVKELVENAIDAGSTEIIIELLRGGLDLIRIRDNGEGIAKEDLVLAISRHATSKIKTVSDLQAIASLGFRGEALASIAAVSRFKLLSKTKADQAWSLSLEPLSLIPDIKPVSHPQGTTVEVSDLFYSIPVRRKFLKSEKTERLQIETVIKQIALCYPQVSFILKQEKSTLVNLRSQDTLSRLSSILGKGFLAEARQVSANEGEFSLDGWAGTAESARSQQDQQYCFVNGRIVRDKLIQHAIKMAYEELIPPGRYPVYVLYFNLPALDLDVNVHPTKHELRFYQPRQVHDFISFNLRKALVYPSAVESISEKTEVLEKEILPFQPAISASSFPKKVTEPNSAYFHHLIQKLDRLPSRLTEKQTLLEKDYPHEKIAYKNESFIEKSMSLDTISPLANPGDTLISYQFHLDYPKPLLSFIFKDRIALISLDKLYKHFIINHFKALSKQKKSTTKTIDINYHLILSQEHSEIILDIINTLFIYGIELVYIEEKTCLIKAVPELLSQIDFSSVLNVSIKEMILNLNEKTLKQWINNFILASPNQGFFVKNIIETIESKEDFIHDYPFLITEFDTL